MGLGKTCQAITACDLSFRRRVLVLCPAAVKTVWEREFKRFSPNRTINVMNKGTDKIGERTVVICSYSLGTTKKMKKRLLTRTWDAIICDEAHFLKGHTSKRTRLVFNATDECLSARASVVWLLSGTPMPNAPNELFPVARFFGITRSYGAFIYRYCEQTRVPIGNGNFVTKVIGANEKTAYELNTLLQPFFLRRLVQEVAPDLPKLSHNFVAIERSACDEVMLEELDILERSVHQNAIVNYLKGARLAYLDDGHISKIRRLTAAVKAFPVAEWVMNGVEGGMFKKAVIFAFHLDAISVLTDLFTNRFHVSFILTGGMAAKNREKAIQGFINYDGACFLIANIMVGGVGIDGLQYATSDVVFLETTWTPSDYVQAVRRVCRHGQAKPVRSWVLTVPKTVDDRVGQTVVRKSQDVSLFFDSSEDTKYENKH